MSATKKRLPELDIAKMIAISLIIIQHTGKLPDRGLFFVTLMALPTFWILSGAMMGKSRDEQLTWNSFYYKKARTLLIPYVSFSILIEVAYWIFAYFTGARVDDPVLFADQITRTVTLMGMSTLWFLSTLFLMELLFYGYLQIDQKILYIQAKPLIRILVMVLFPVLGFTLMSYFQTLDIYAKGVFVDALRIHRIVYFWMILLCRVLVLMPFLFVGYFCRDIWELVKTSKRFLVIATVVSFLLTWILSGINKSAEMSMVVLWGSSHVLYYISACLGALGVLGLSTLIGMLGATKGFGKKLVDVLCYFGKNSLIIMATHLDLYVLFLVSYPVLVVLNRIPTITDGGRNALAAIGMLVGTLVVEIPIIAIINRYFSEIFTGKKHEGVKRGI